VRVSPEATSCRRLHHWHGCLSGFALDLASAAGTGINRVHIYLDGPYGTGTIIGGATYGLNRPDVAA